MTFNWPDIPFSGTEVDAFVAEYNRGGSVIGILGEYDALPGLSQTTSTKKTKREGTNSGHACGHNLFGVASAAAAISIKEWLDDSKKEGTVRFYGCPAEEGGSGKVYMVREGLFDDVDVALHWHPSGSNAANASSSLSNKTGKFRFYGKSAHAASAPDQGRSALDGLEAMNHMVNMMREHVEEESRIHYVITKGGDAPNVVPNFTEGYFYVRHPDPEQVREVWERVVLAAQGAAMGTETTVEYEVTGGVYNILPNETLQEIIHDKLETVGGVYYDEDEKKYAEEISLTLKKRVSLSTSEEVMPYKVINSTKGGGSTDVGDVSWVTPTVQARVATCAVGTPFHTWQTVAQGKAPVAHKGMVHAAKVMAATATHLIKSPETLRAARDVHDKRQQTTPYLCPIPQDVKPPVVEAPSL